MIDKNLIVIQGTIVRIIPHKKRTVIQVITDGGDKINALVNVVFFDKWKVRAFDVDFRVTIKAHAQLDKIPSDGKEKYVQIIVGDSIEETKRLICQEFSKEEIGIVDAYDGGVPVDINKALFAGEVMDVHSPNEKTTRFTIRMKIGRMFNRARIYCFKRQSEIASSLSPGDRVAVVCAIRTDNKPSKYMPDHEVFYCKDLTLLNDDEESASK